MVVVDSVAVHISVSQHLIRLRTWSRDINVETRGLVDGIALMDSRNGAICTLIVFVENMIVSVTTGSSRSHLRLRPSNMHTM